MKCIGALIDPIDRPVAGVFAATMFSLAAVALVFVAALMTLRSSVNWLTVCPLFLIYVASLSATLWCSNTGEFGFGICGSIGVVFCVLVYYSSLAVDNYKPMTVADEEEYDPRVTEAY